MLDDLTRRARESGDARWDDVTARAVYEGIGPRVRQVRQARRRRRLIGAAAALAVAGLVLGISMRQRGRPAPTSLDRTQPGAAAIRLRDGSRAELEAGARVAVLLDGADLVRLEQSEGTARYVVVHSPTRVFEVIASDVRVRVLGTIFTITVGRGEVAVSVQRGRVSVDQAGRGLLLAQGERILLNREAGAPAAPRTDLAPPPPPPPEAQGARSLRHTVAPTPVPRSPDEVLRAIDDDRAAGRLEEAETLLHQFVREHARDSRATSAWFTLGRVERSLGRHAAAAEAFRTARTRSPSGTLAEDALAEEAASLARSGRAGAAREVAGRYLERYPHGAQTARMRAILE
jgi:FecR-like protein/tetratricopeptide repeat protein